MTSEDSPSVQLCARITSQAEVQLNPFNLNVAYGDLTAGELILVIILIADCAHSHFTGTTPVRFIVALNIGNLCNASIGEV